ncbi:sporulation protein [Bacillus salitolerans]|uniref:Sporulation protein n=1 Tax=Bacillus salitolerans TaxID=1437434 RepID=A0ABW4LTV1_9BACI
MEQTLGYLREILSNYLDHQAQSRQIYEKLESTQYENEQAFVRALDEEETLYLNKILPDEINHALEEQDYTRMSELNNVYELLI